MVTERRSVTLALFASPLDVILAGQNHSRICYTCKCVACKLPHRGSVDKKARVFIVLALSLAASSAASVGPPRLLLRPCVFCNDGSVNRQPSRTVGTFFYRDKKRARAKKGSPRIIPSRGCVRFIVAPLRTAFPPPFRRVSYIARARRRRIVVMTTTTGRTALILPITSPADPQPG